MKLLKKRLEPEQYELLKEIDFSEIEDHILFDDKNCEFETDSDLFDVLFDVHIVKYGMDENQNECTEYGKKLYDLYDEIFFTD